MFSSDRSPSLAVCAVTDGEISRAGKLAERLGLPLLATGEDPAARTDFDVLLMVDDGSLVLQQTGKGAPGPVQVNFSSGDMQHRRRTGGAELLGRAVGFGARTPLRVLDVTAGLGRDAFLLADLGCEVSMCERNPVIAELLQAQLEVARGPADSRLHEIVARMQFEPGDATQVNAGLLRSVDVIYMDPMFPQRGKSAAVKKEMAMFQALLGHADPADSDTLLRWALQQDVARVVIKRPLKAPPLAELSPSHDIRGKSVRFDVHVRRKLQ